MLLTTDGRRPLIVKPIPLRVLASLFVAFSLFGAVMAWRAGQGNVSPWFLVFGAIGVYLLLDTGSIEMDAKTIKYRTPLAQYQIEWDEVTQIQVDRGGGNMVFFGKDKRLATIGPTFWSGKDKLEMLILADEQIKKHGVETQVTNKAMFRLSKGTKIRGLTAQLRKG